MVCMIEGFMDGNHCKSGAGDFGRTACDFSESECIRTIFKHETRTNFV